MSGFNSITGDESIMTADNCSFDGTDRGGRMTTNGQLWIGSTASNRAPNAGHVRLGSLTSPLGTITIGYSAPNITLDLTGGIAATAFDVQANTAPGTDPVVPTAAGLVTVNGAAVANHSVVLETRSRAANAYNLEVQYATSAAATDATKSGVALFNSAQFSVDANGFVSTTGIPANAITKVIVQTFTSSGTYTPTTGMKYVTLEVVGSGAGGGGAASTGATQVAAAAGGGPGGYARKTVAAAVIGASQTVTVGAGGAGGSAGNNNGTNGNTSSVGAIVSASGGLAGGGSGAGNIAGVNPGASGIGSSGDINSVGAEGVPSYAIYLAVFTSGMLMGGGGGNSYFGGGARGGVAFSGAFNGINGFAYGGGGSGGFSGVSAAAASGGNGSDGVVICTEYVSA